MNFGNGVTYTYIDFEVDTQIPLLSQLHILKEDLIQIQYGKYLLDIGWYPEFYKNGQFRIVIVKDELWDSPIIEKKCRDLNKVDKYIKECIGYIQMKI